MESNLEESVFELSKIIQETRDIIVTAESCTGGMVGSLITSVPGSSSWFDRGFITYSNDSKQVLLGVPEKILKTYGAVSCETVAHMLKGALKNSNATLAVAISGIAGPTGGSPQKPVGTVVIGWMLKDECPNIKVFHFDGNRQSVRDQAAFFAIKGMTTLLSEMKGTK